MQLRKLDRYIVTRCRPYLGRLSDGLRPVPTGQATAGPTPAGPLYASPIFPGPFFSGPNFSGPILTSEVQR
ncbi:MAG: hypothetical protein ACRCYU_00450 [Nocardioides sp.]